MALTGPYTQKAHMSLDFRLSVDGDEVYSRNITHNLNKMAEAAGIYTVLWRPDENGITKAHQCIEPLRTGLGNRWKSEMPVLRATTAPSSESGRPRLIKEM